MSKTDVLFQKGTLDEINSTDKVDGQILLTTDLGLNNKIFTDVKQSDGTIERVKIAGANDIDEYLSDTSTNPVMNKAISVEYNGIRSDIEATEAWNTYNRQTLDDIIEGYGEYAILWERDATADAKGYPVYPKASTIEERTKGLPQEYTFANDALISDMPHGIILVFSAVNLKYTKPTGSSTIGTVTYSPQNYHFVTFFVHKKEVELFPSAGHSFFLIGANNFAWTSTSLHYLYISDDKIKDNSLNLFDCANYTSYSNYDTNTMKTGGNGIKYSNSRFCIREIIGV